MKIKRYESIFKEASLNSNDSLKKWANDRFAKELSELKVGTIVWLQDKRSNYQGYYEVTKNGFLPLGSMPQGKDFKDYQSKNPIKTYQE